MVGPSSSHTAGACKLGQIARALFHGTPDKVTFYLHGSFAKVYKGHATDRALLGGVMKFKTSDARIPAAFAIAHKIGLKYEFKKDDLGPQYHPNSVKIVMEKAGRKPMSVIGSSIGGGIVKVTKIDQFEMDLHGVAGHFKTLVVWHDPSGADLDGLLRKLASYGVRVHDIQTAKVDGHALSLINMEGRALKLSQVLELELMRGIENVRSLTPLQKNGA